MPCLGTSQFGPRPCAEAIERRECSGALLLCVLALPELSQALGEAKLCASSLERADLVLTVRQRAREPALALVAMLDQPAATSERGERRAASGAPRVSLEDGQQLGCVCWAPVEDVRLDQVGSHVRSDCRVGPALLALLADNLLQMRCGRPWPSASQLEQPERGARTVELRACSEPRRYAERRGNVGAAIGIPTLGCLQPPKRAERKTLVRALTRFASQSDRFVEHAGSRRPAAAFQLEIREADECIGQETQRTLGARFRDKLLDYDEGSVVEARQPQTPSEIGQQLATQLGEVVSQVGGSPHEFSARFEAPGEDERCAEHQTRPDLRAATRALGEPLGSTRQFKRLLRSSASQAGYDGVGKHERRAPWVLLLTTIGGGNEGFACSGCRAHASCYAAAKVLDFGRQGPVRDVGARGVEVVERSADVPREIRRLGGAEKSAGPNLRIRREPRGELEGARRRPVSAPVARSARCLGQGRGRSLLRCRRRSS